VPPFLDAVLGGGVGVLVQRRLRLALEPGRQGGDAAVVVGAGLGVEPASDAEVDEVGLAVVLEVGRVVAGDGVIAEGGVAATAAASASTGEGSSHCEVGWMCEVLVRGVGERGWQQEAEREVEEREEEGMEEGDMRSLEGGRMAIVVIVDEDNRPWSIGRINRRGGWWRAGGYPVTGVGSE
jgi:hypothetical protein